MILWDIRFSLALKFINIFGENLHKCQHYEEAIFFFKWIMVIVEFMQANIKKIRLFTLCKTILSLNSVLDLLYFVILNSILVYEPILKKKKNVF